MDSGEQCSNSNRVSYDTNRSPLTMDKIAGKTRFYSIGWKPYERSRVDKNTNLPAIYTNSSVLEFFQCAFCLSRRKRLSSSQGRKYVEHSEDRP